MGHCAEVVHAEQIVIRVLLIYDIKIIKIIKIPKDMIEKGQIT